MVGPSGSGKTTLAQVLLRFLDADAGFYTLAGVDAYALAGDDVRRLVGAVRAGRAPLRQLGAREPAPGQEGRHRGRTARRAGPGPAAGVGRTACPTAWTRWSVSTGPGCAGGQAAAAGTRPGAARRLPRPRTRRAAEHLDLPTADALTGDLLAATEGPYHPADHAQAGGSGGRGRVIVLGEGRAAQRGDVRGVGGAGAGAAAGDGWSGEAAGGSCWWGAH
ncbi:hypothetical protein LV779_38070 [Streptomyces thinghirensis]|nr:hypothetical protein [Streptomyces thinghirensis]